MEPIEITIKMTVDKWNVILMSLGKMPFDQVINVINDIKAQADQQINAQATPEQQMSPEQQFS